MKTYISLGVCAMRLKFCILVFVPSLVCLAPRGVLADSPGRSSGAASAVISFDDFSAAAANGYRTTNQLRHGDDTSGAKAEAFSLLLLGAAFGLIGIAVAAASRRRTAEPDQAPAWTSAVLEE